MKAAQYPLHHVTYTCAKFEFDMSNGLGEDAYTTRKYINTIAHEYPLHHVTYTHAKFEVATSNDLGEDSITKNMTDAQTDDRPTLVRIN